MSRVARVAVVTSHPIQYHAPWFRALAQVVDLEVFYCHRQDAAGQAAAGFGQPFEWDVPLLEGYRYRWLENVSPTPHVESFRGCDTPAVARARARRRLRRVRRHRLVSEELLCRRFAPAGTRACRFSCAATLTWARRGRPLKTAAKFCPYRWMLRQMDAHLFVGEANRAYLRHYGVPETQLFFAPHFVENDRFSRGAIAPAKAVPRRPSRGAGVPKGAVVFLFAGKLLAQKRADGLRAGAGGASRRAAASSTASSSGRDLKSRRAPQAAMLGAPVHFAGFHNQTAMPVAYAAADCLVLPS